MRDRFMGSPEQARYERRLEEMTEEVDARAHTKNLQFDSRRSAILVSSARRCNTTGSSPCGSCASSPQTVPTKRGDGFTFSQIAMDQFPEAIRRRRRMLDHSSYQIEDLVEFILYVSRYARKPSITNLSTKS